MSDALTAVMNAAAAAADAAPAASANLPATQTNSNVPVARPSLDSMTDSAGLTVDHYLNVMQGGFRLGDMKGYFTEAEVTLDLDEVVAIYQVRANRSGQTTFIKSYDGVTTNTGQNFDLATRQLQQTNDKVDGPYQTAEIPVTLTKDVTDGKVKVEAGATIGVTPSITGVKFFTKFVKAARARGLTGDIRVKLVHTPQTNTKGNEWGVVAFELID